MNCGRRFGVMCLLHHAGHRCCRGNGHEGEHRCACGAEDNEKGKR